MFISKHYAEKMWTSHERKSSLVRALQERGDNILPARFDDTEIPGIRPTVAFVAIAKRKPADFAKLLLAKLGRNE